MIIGIDPGLTGAIAILGSGGPRLTQMPTVARANGKGRRVNPVRVHALLKNTPKLIVIEQVRAMPSKGGKRKMGAQSSFNFGEGFGAVWTAAMLSGVPVHFVEAARWKRRAGLIGKPKEAALTLARQLYPDATESLRHGRGYGTKDEAIGRADALLIARFGADIAPVTVEDFI